MGNETVKVQEVKRYLPKGLRYEVAHITTECGREFMTRFDIHDVEVGDEVRIADSENCLGYTNFYANKK